MCTYSCQLAATKGDACKYTIFGSTPIIPSQLAAMVALGHQIAVGQVIKKDNKTVFFLRRPYGTRKCGVSGVIHDSNGCYMVLYDRGAYGIYRRIWRVGPYMQNSGWYNKR